MQLYSIRPGSSSQVQVQGAHPRPPSARRHMRRDRQVSIPLSAREDVEQYVAVASHSPMQCDTITIAYGGRPRLRSQGLVRLRSGSLSAKRCLKDEVWSTGSTPTSRSKFFAVYQSILTPPLDLPTTDATSPKPGANTQRGANSNAASTVAYQQTGDSRGAGARAAGQTDTVGLCHIACSRNIGFLAKNTVADPPALTVLKEEHRAEKKTSLGFRAD
jgi:hypothetical protein